jgi:hypothetical protein
MPTQDDSSLRECRSLHGDPPNLLGAGTLHAILSLMKAALALLLLLVAIASAQKPWPGVEFTEVRAYAWRGQLEVDHVILPGMTLAPGVLNRDGALLDAAQVKRLLSAVTGKHRQLPLAGCYLPHNAFVFYDREKNPVAFVEICFTCIGHRIEPKGAAASVDLVALATLFTERLLPLGRYPDVETFKLHLRRILGSSDK